MSVDAGGITIAPESPYSPGVAELIAASDAFSVALYPPESNHLVPIDELAVPAVRFFVARMGGTAVGCVAYRLGPVAERSAEVKRLYVADVARGRDLGRKLMQTIEVEALIEGIVSFRLETGIHNHAALKLYRALGFDVTGPFPPYADDPLSVFMHKLLV